MSETSQRFTADDARAIGEEIGIDWDISPFDVEQFRVGMTVELEHGLRDERTNVSNDDPHVTAKIALAHLNEFPTTTPSGAHGRGSEARLGSHVKGPPANARRRHCANSTSRIRRPRNTSAWCKVTPPSASSRRREEHGLRHLDAGAASPHSAVARSAPGQHDGGGGRRPVGRFVA